LCNWAARSGPFGLVIADADHGPPGSLRVTSAITAESDYL
jgi:hypothetical protein